MKPNFSIKQTFTYILQLKNKYPTNTLMAIGNNHSIKSLISEITIIKCKAM